MKIINLRGKNLTTQDTKHIVKEVVDVFGRISSHPVYADGNTIIEANGDDEPVYWRIVNVKRENNGIITSVDIKC